MTNTMEVSSKHLPTNFTSYSLAQSRNTSCFTVKWEVQAMTALSTAIRQWHAQQLISGSRRRVRGTTGEKKSSVTAIVQSEPPNARSARYLPAGPKLGAARFITNRIQSHHGCTKRYSRLCHRKLRATLSSLFWPFPVIRRLCAVETFMEVQSFSNQTWLMLGSMLKCREVRLRTAVIKTGGSSCPHVRLIQRCCVQVHPGVLLLLAHSPSSCALSVYFQSAAVELRV